ncbi:MAG: VCBS repeat-containing protein [candidate division WOR-3 bacterium]
MKQVTMLIVACLLGATSADELLEIITTTGPADSVPGLVTVRGTGLTASCHPMPELPIMPGWPKETSTSANFAPSRGIALADFDGDGRLEVIMPSTAGQLHVWKYDGTYYPGWPRTLPGMGQYAAAVADIDLDGEYEVAVCTRGMTSGGAVCVFTEGGTPKPGWPFTGLVGGNFSDSPTLADLNGDDTLEIIVGERNYPIGHLHVLTHRGTEYPGAWPCSLDHVPAMGAAVGDLDLDGKPEIVYASYNSLYVFEPDGRLRAGWPQTNPNGGYFSYQSPALADLDGDDTLEIVVAEHRDGSGTYVFRHDGTILAGWPYRFPRWTYCPPTACDLYRNQDLKVLCGQTGIMGGAAAVLYGFSSTGSVLPGFPVVQPNGDAAEGNIAVADIDGDGDMEVIFSSNVMYEGKGYMYAVHHDGSAVSGWPLRPTGFTYLNGATVADIDGDDSLDIVVVSDNSTVMSVTVYEAGVPFSRAVWEWPTYQFDMCRTGLYRPYRTGIAQPRTQASVRQVAASMVRGVLLLPEGYSDERGASTVLLDISGRKMMELAPGPNDIRHLAPGVYFLQQANQSKTRGQGVCKIIVAR